MPFERYIRYAPEHDPNTQTLESHQPSAATYSDYGVPPSIPGRSDPYGYDHTIFSHNVQFQMPQLVLGPTLAPGGGMEVLPAGMVNRPPIASSWLAGAPTFRSFTDDS